MFRWAGRLCGWILLAGAAFGQTDPKALALCGEANRIARELTQFSGLELRHAVPCDFITKEKTTKHSNLVQNPKAALAIFEAATQTTLQLTGTVTPIDDLDQLHEMYRRIVGITLQTTYKQTPPFSKLEAGSEKAYCLKPDRVRLAQYMQTQQQVEKDFDIFELVELPG